MMIITDTAADIMEEEAAKLNIRMVQIDIIFPDTTCPHNTPESFARFYQLLESSPALPSTSQPSPQEYLDLYEEAIDRNEEVLVITLSSGLSGTYSSATTAKNIAGSPLIHVVDSRQAIIPQRILVEQAVQMRDQGYSINDIVQKLEDLREKIEVCGALDTLTYLKKGGRVPASIATIGNLIGIKPVVALLDTVVKSIGKARGMKSAKECLLREYEKAEIDPSFPVYFGYTRDEEPARKFMEEFMEHYHIDNVGIYPVGGTIGTHLGPSAVLLVFVSKNAVSNGSIES